MFKIENALPEYYRVMLKKIKANAHLISHMMQCDNFPSQYFQAVTPKEETDLETLMSQCDFAISNAELFAKQLEGDLSVLDGVCIHI